MKSKEDFPVLAEKTSPMVESNEDLASPEISGIEITPKETVVESQYEQISSGRLNQGPRVGTGRVIKSKKEIKDSDYRGFTTKTRQQRSMRTENQKVLPSRNSCKDSEDFIQTQNFTNKNQIAKLEKDISQLNIQDGVYRSTNRNSGNRQGSVPLRIQNSEQKGSKRYSNMRQKSLPEATTPPTAAANFSFYPNDYNSTAPPPATQQPIMPTAIPSPATLVPPQVPVSAAAAPPALLQAPFAPPPNAFAAQPPPPPAYLQAAPPPFMAPPPTQAQIVTYVTQAQPPYVQGFQGQFNSVTQSTELYQPQGGITYYSADQQMSQRSVPTKRPKAAIPIVDPTEFKEGKEKEGQTKVEECLSGCGDTPHENE
ncbi:hypothetical protein ABEB36_007961 [Hypothenemus hampei]|uniref:Uncharacterized protein n=1 Tax=Hypothenemus hampei TaxID=57062 RepID=A0ABD1EWB1_HYPHA